MESCTTNSLEFKTTCLALAGLTVALRASGEIVTKAAVSRDCGIELDMEESSLFRGFTQHSFSNVHPQFVLPKILSQLDDNDASQLFWAQYRVAAATEATIVYADFIDELELSETACYQKVSHWASSILEVANDRLDLGSDFCNSIATKLYIDNQLISANWSHVFWTYLSLCHGPLKGADFSIPSTKKFHFQPATMQATRQVFEEIREKCDQLLDECEHQ